jgi:hypothetical protein
LNCRECEEQIAAWSRDEWPGEEPPALSGAAAAHLERCSACHEYREAARQTMARLAAWELPALEPRRLAAGKEALVARLAAVCAPQRAAESAAPAAQWDARPSRPNSNGLAGRIGRHPAILGLLGAAAAGAGAAAAPGWFQQVVIGWAAGAAVLASLVLLLHGRSLMTHGERL